MIDAVQLVVEVQSTCNFTRKVQYFIIVSVRLVIEPNREYTAFRLPCE